MIENKQDFLARSNQVLTDIYSDIYNQDSIFLSELDPDKTALVIVDMINGFSKEGPLKSDRVVGIIEEIAMLSEAFSNSGITKIAFGDSHNNNSPEFCAYPPHCLTGSKEAELVDELIAVGGYLYIAKNSTNGFLEEEFQNWLMKNDHINCFVIVGDCTDICIQQFATTMKTWFNKRNRTSRVIVPINAVETFDLGLHDAEIVNLMALFFMKGNGIEIVRSINI